MTNLKARNFRNYKVWQDAVDYASKVYQVTSDMPWFEKKGLCDQLQRAVVSISSNIAEGSAKPSDLEFAHYLDTALGGAYEVETQLLIAHKVKYIDNETWKIGKEISPLNGSVLNVKYLDSKHKEHNITEVLK